MESKILKLTTGQKLIVAEDPGLPLVDLYLLVRAGSILDSPATEGAISFMGEMLLRGTKNRTRAQITDALDQLGAEIHVEVSAEDMMVQGKTLSRNLEKFLEIYSDIILNPIFDENEIEKLKRETLADFKQMREDDQELVGRFFKRALYGKHPYGMLTDGRESTIPKINRKRLIDSYDALFTQENTFFAAAGEIKAQVLSQRLSRDFSAMKKSKPTIVSIPEFEKMEGRTLVLVDKPKRTQTKVIVGHYGINHHHPDFFPMMIANNAFGGGGFATRLMQEVRVKRGWSYGAGSVIRPRKKNGEFYMVVMPAAKDALNALSLVLSLYETYQKEGISEVEFELSKKNLINEFAFKMDTAKKLIGQAISIELMGLPQDYFSTYQQKLKAVTLADVNRAVQAHSDPKNVMMVMVGTASDFKAKLKSQFGPDLKVILKKYTDDD
ncbi:MAG: insulinase family protein [Deltaproteobacteria bacterium]|nr:insulinase family protein [Deltaproteobacteria bacterium]